MNFINSSTTLPPVKTFQQGPSKRVTAIQFVQQDADLTATIRLPFPYFTIKSFHFTNPDRIVVDAHITLSPMVKSKRKEPLGDKTLIKTLTQPQNTVAEQSPSVSPEKFFGEVPNQWSKSPLPEIILSSNKPDRSKDANGGISIKQPYLIVGLIVPTAVGVMILFIRLRRNHPRDSKQLFKLVGMINNSNQLIKELDQQLISEFRKFEDF